MVVDRIEADDDSDWHDRVGMVGCIKDKVIGYLYIGVMDGWIDGFIYICVRAWNYSINH